MAHIGIDVSKNKLDLCWLRERGKVKTKVFTNHPKHYPALMDWLTRQTGEQARICAYTWKRPAFTTSR
ncbi:hypothetical protein ASALC70_01866 [Alcanivorax sp. ALC70]|nr:hypothetical protein ASALC70_01866 [Alcanivorax sp. ALC70]